MGTLALQMGMRGSERGRKGGGEATSSGDLHFLLPRYFNAGGGGGWVGGGVRMGWGGGGKMTGDPCPLIPGRAVWLRRRRVACQTASVTTSRPQGRDGQPVASPGDRSPIFGGALFPATQKLPRALSGARRITKFTTKPETNKRNY